MRDLAEGPSIHRLPSGSEGSQAGVREELVWNQDRSLRMHTHWVCFLFMFGAIPCLKVMNLLLGLKKNGGWKGKGSPSTGGPTRCTRVGDPTLPFLLDCKIFFFLFFFFFFFKDSVLVRYCIADRKTVDWVIYKETDLFS